ncbi:MAG: hypothetical protein ACRDHZ_18680 [Ktedonobacteraceae bacterium]
MRRKSGNEIDDLLRGLVGATHSGGADELGNLSNERLGGRELGVEFGLGTTLRWRP